MFITAKFGAPNRVFPASLVSVGAFLSPKTVTAITAGSVISGQNCAPSPGQHAGPQVTQVP